MLTSKGKLRVIKRILNSPTAEIKVRKLAKELGISPAHVSKTLKALRDEGIVKDGRVDLSAPMARALKVFLNVERLVEIGVVDEIKSLGGVAGAGIYGSWANGTNHEDSDLDLWIRVEKHPGEMKVASLVGEIRKSVGAEVQMLVLTPEDLERLRREDPAFYHSLVFGSFVMWGEPIG
jgi:predicted nucleotidyltransferase